MDRLRTAPHAAAARPPGGWPHPGQSLGAVAPARVLDPLAEAHRHPPEGHRCGLRRVRPCAYWFAPGHHVGRQQHEGQRADGHPDARLVEHLLQRCPDRAIPGSERARQLSEPDDSCVGLNAGSDRPDAGATGLQSGGSPRAARALRPQSDLPLTPIHPSVWKVNSANYFAFRDFSEVASTLVTLHTGHVDQLKVGPKGHALS
jgi:hypothetical protein